MQQNLFVCKRDIQHSTGFTIMENMEIIKTPEEVNARIKEMGAEIANAYNSEPLTMLVIMNGGLFFAAKLAEAIKKDDFYIRDKK